MTANVFWEDIERCLAVWMNDHLGKPIVHEDLFVKLGAYLPKAKAPRGGAAAEAPLKDGGQANADFAKFLPAVDVQSGLERLQNNKRLYRKMLKNFKVETMDEEVLQSISSGDIAKAVEAAHALKGAALNLGLAEIADAASRVASLKSLEGDSRQLLEPLKQAVDAAATAIARLLKEVEEE